MTNPLKLHKSHDHYRPHIPFPHHLTDPSSFNINITLWGKNLVKVMLDFGVDINLMLYSIYLQLDLGELKTTTIFLQLAYMSIKYPNVTIDNFLIQVDKLILLVDFVVLDMKENTSMDEEHTLLHDR